MIHRMLILILVAGLLGGCSSGEATSDGDAPEVNPAMETGETSASTDAAVGEATGGVPDIIEQTPDPVSESASEATDDQVDSEEPPLVESASGFDPPPTPVASASGLRVLRAYVCKGIEQGEPTEAGKSFVPEDGVLRLCCFSEIAGAAGPDTVMHIWSWGDREMARVVLEVKSSRWRTWSTKRILDEWRGEWHVDVTDSEGGLLTRLEFSVE